MTWSCKSCGSCCRVAGIINPEWDRGDGGCKYLNTNNLCLIYDKRPEICRTKEGDDKLKHIACEKLQRFVADKESLNVFYDLLMPRAK